MQPKLLCTLHATLNQRSAFPTIFNHTVLFVAHVAPAGGMEGAAAQVSTPDPAAAQAAACAVKIKPAIHRKKPKNDTCQVSLLTAAQTNLVPSSSTAACWMDMHEAAGDTPYPSTCKEQQQPSMLQTHLTADTAVLNHKQHGVTVRWPLGMCT